jgi:hypothetical protein
MGVGANWVFEGRFAREKPCSGRDQKVRLRCAANGLMDEETLMVEEALELRRGSSR